MTQFASPQAAYRANYALLDVTLSSLVEDGNLFFRHIKAGGIQGTIYTVPAGSIALEDVVLSHGHGVLKGAPLPDVEAAATERRSMQ